MYSSLFKFFLFAIIVQSFHSSDASEKNSNSSPKTLQEIIDIEKQEQQQRGPASYADKAKAFTSKVLESEATPTKGAKEAAKPGINEATTAADKDLNKAEGRDIITDLLAESELEKHQKQQRERASYLDKVMTSISKSPEIETYARDSKTPIKEIENIAAKLYINEATTAANDDSNRAEVPKKKKYLNKGKGKVDNTEEKLEDLSHVSIQLTPSGDLHSSDLNQPLNMLMDNRFNELIITEASLPEVQISTKITNPEDTDGTGNDGQNRRRNRGRREKGSAKGKNKNHPPKREESSGDLIGSESGKTNENENDTFDYNSYEETPIILTEMQLSRFKDEFEPFIARQEKLLEKELKKLNDGEILKKSIGQLLSGMNEERHGGDWHKAVRKVLVTITGGTHRFWRENVAQIVSKKPLVIYKIYSTMTAIYLGPKEGRNAEVKKMIPRVNKITSMVHKAFVMYNQKSVEIFTSAVNTFDKEIKNFHAELVRINNKSIDMTKKEREIIEKLRLVTIFYKDNFVEEVKYNELFQVPILMIDEMKNNGAKMYSCLMRLANEKSAEIINNEMVPLFHMFENGNYQAYVMQLFNVYFKLAHEFPSELDIAEMNKAHTRQSPIFGRHQLNRERQFPFRVHPHKAEFEQFIARQEKLLEKELKKLNDWEILHKPGDKIWAGMTEEKHNGIWHNAVRKLLLKIMHGTKTFWRVNVAQYLSKEPWMIFQFYSVMTGIYLGQKRGTSAEAKKMLPRVNKIQNLIYKGIVMHNKKSLELFVDAVRKFAKELTNVYIEVHQQKSNSNDAQESKRIITKKLQSATKIYKENFVTVEKFNEFFHVSLLMVNQLQTDCAYLYSNTMELANAQSAEMITKYMGPLFQNNRADFKAHTMEIFKAYTDFAHEYPAGLDISDMDVVPTGGETDTIQH